MLYDQGQLAVAYSSAFLATKDQIYAQLIEDILEYVNRDLSHPVSFILKYFLKNIFGQN